MTDAGRTVVIGVGNPVRSDDGAGLSIARAVRARLAGRPGVDVAELWAGGLRLAEAMCGYRRAIVCDALDTRTVPAGTVVRLSLADLGTTRNVNCVHDASLPAALEVLRALGAAVPEAVAVWGIEAADLETLHEGLTPAVARAVDGAAQRVLDEIDGGPAR